MQVCMYPQNCPQMALHCYKEALETDPPCVGALYQSILVYRKLDNTQAEIQALRLLHAVSNTSTQEVQHEKILYCFLSGSNGHAGHWCSVFGLPAFFPQQ